MASTSLTGSFVSYLLDMLPILLAGLALYGPSLGLDGTPLDLSRELRTDEAGVSLGLSVVGMLIGLQRGAHRASLRLGLGIFLCAFSAIYAGLKFL